MKPLQTKGDPMATRGAYKRGAKLPFAPDYMIELERRYLELRAERAEYESAMRHEGSNNRRGSVEAHAPSAVTATTVRASRLPRVHDSFDARPASQRAAQRPYSGAVFSQDVATRSKNRKHSGAPFKFTVPAWFIAALEGLDSKTRTAALAGFTRTEMAEVEYERKLKPRVVESVDYREARRAAQRDIAGTIRMAEID